MNEDPKPILVVGGGIAGMTAAVEAAEVGYRSILVEREAYLGGRVVRFHQYFPKMCPPTCGYEINVRRIRQNPRIKVHTLSTVERISGTAGNFKVRIRKNPRHVMLQQGVDRLLTDRLVSERTDDFNLGMVRTKSLYRPFDLAYPPLHLLETEHLSQADAELLREECHQNSLDLDQGVEEMETEVGAVILATGWKPYDASRLENLGFGRLPNVITNVMMERLASPQGPTGGKILRPSDGRSPKNVAFVQCAGSRDENHLPYCSAVCCMASLKQIRYLKEQNQDARTTCFYIDIRTIGRLEKFYSGLLDEPNVTFFKGKVAEIDEDSSCGDLLLKVEDTLKGEKPDLRFDLVVLATGMVPETNGMNAPFNLNYDKYGFIDGSTNVEGVYVAGCARHPCDVSRATKESTAAALRAIQCLNGGAK